MKIELVELRLVHLPLVAPFTTSFATQTVRQALMVRVVADGVEGWGECVTMEAPYYSEEFVEGAAQVMRKFLIPLLLGAKDLSAETVAPTLEHVVGHRMAKAALEMAVLDAQLKAQGQSFARYLGAEREWVPSGVSVGIQSDIAQLLDVVTGYVEEGYVRIKLKIKPGWDLEPVAAVRERFGFDLPLQVDANSAYRLSDSTHLRKLDQFDLLLVEQPLYEDDLRLHAELATMMTTPICLDESIVSARAAADAIALGATSVINVKPGRVGGYLEARRIHDLGVANGVAVWCGGMLETGVGRAANAALAALPGFTLPGDISASSRFYAEDITEPIVMENGQIRVPDAPGVGPAPIMERLDAATQWQEEIRPE